jgi:hypothetical protein
MRPILPLSLFLACLSLSQAASATTITGSGYTATDAIPFQWDELSPGYNNPIAGAHRVLGNDDDSLASVSMEYSALYHGNTSQVGMGFSMFGHTISSSPWAPGSYSNPGTMFISSNGLLTFGCPAHLNASGQTITCYPTTNSHNAALGTTATSDTIHAPSVAVAWDDWTTTPNGTDGVYWAFLGNDGAKRLVVEWRNTRNYNGGTTPVSFEAVLYEGTNQIELRYLQMNTGSSGTAQGASATVGIRDWPTMTNGATGTYLQWSLNQSVLGNGTSILFTPDAVGQSGSVPEPGTCGLLLASLGLMGRSLKRRSA